MEHPGKFIKENGKTYFEVTLKMLTGGNHSNSLHHKIKN